MFARVCKFVQRVGMCCDPEACLALELVPQRLIGEGLPQLVLPDLPHPRIGQCGCNVPTV